jgi:ribosome production factor 2
LDARLGGKRYHSFDPSETRCCGPCPFYSAENIQCSTEKIPSVPRNARSKRALEARAPREIEDGRTAIYVRGSHTGEVLNGVMKDLVRCHSLDASPVPFICTVPSLTRTWTTKLLQMVLKRPHAISFSKKNEIHPFEPTGIQSLEFWSTKNNATFFVVGTNTKKR